MIIYVRKEVDSIDLDDFLIDIKKIVDAPGVPMKNMYVEHQNDSTINICYQREMTEGELRDREKFLKQEESYEYASYLRLKERF